MNVVVNYEIDGHMQLMIKDRWSLWLFTSAFIINLAQWGIAWFWPRGSSLAPLHYTIYFGIDLSGPWWWIYGLPLVGSVIIIAHFFIAVFDHATLWTRIWALVALVLNVFLLGALGTLWVLIRT